MKKLIYCAAALVTALFAGSCQRELLDPAGEGNTVTFTVEIPEVATKAVVVEDGSNINNLVYAVYRTEESDLATAAANLNPNMLVYSVNPKATGGATKFTKEGKTNVTLELINNQKYIVLFWAQVDQTWVAGKDFDLTEIAYPAKLVANKNKYAAFAGAAYVEVTGASRESVTLTRPFAQINLATANPTNYVVDIVSSSVKVDNVYPTFNVATKKAYGELRTVEYTQSENPDGSFGDYAHYVAMNYIFANPQADGTTQVKVTCTMDTANHGTGIVKEISNVPVAQNYKTNIVGNLLTSEVDYTVELVKDWTTPDNEVKVVSVSSAQDLAAAIEELNESTQEGTETQITLGDDINLNDLFPLTRTTVVETDPTLTIAAGKALTLDLNGKTLSATSYQTGKNYNMLDVRGNLTVKNGTIKYKHEGDNMGWGNSTNIFNVTAGGVLNLEGVTAKNLGGSDMAFVAHLNNWGEVTLNADNCTLESSYIAVRVFNSGPDMNNVNIKNSTLKGKFAFWVHNYTAEDFKSEAKAESQKALLNLNIYNQGNTFSPDVNGILYGFTGTIYSDSYGITKSVSEDGTEVTLGSLFEDGLIRRGVAGAEENTTIKKVVVEEGVAVLYDRTFRRFYALEEVVLPSTLTTIGATGSGVFQSCNNLKKIVIPESVTVLGKGSFQECTSLESINIPAKVTRIESDALRNTGLKSVEFHAGVTYFGTQAFRDCKQLTEVIINAPEFTMEDNTFGIMAAPFTPMTIYVVNEAMKTYVESKLSDHSKTYITVKAPTAVTDKASLQAAMAKAIKAGEKNIFIDGTNFKGDLNYGFSNANLPAGVTVTIRNAKVTATSKWNYLNGTLIFEDCEFTAGLYSIHFDDDDSVGDVIFKNCKLIGWLPFAAINSVSFENCTLDGNGSYALIRSYADLTLKNCVINTTKANHTDEYTDGVQVINATLTEENVTYIDNHTAYLQNVLKDGKHVVLSSDLTINEGEMMTAPYGNKMALHHNGGVFDGNKKTVSVTIGGDHYAVMTSGGTIKDLTVDNGFRGILIMYPKETIYLNNVVSSGEGVCYALNTAEGDSTQDLVATNCTFNGWSSWSLLKSATFTNCTFGQGQYYTNVYGRLGKPYVNTVFDGCDFCSKYYVDLSALEADQKVTLKNCTVNGVKITAENWTSLVAPEDTCGEGQISVELKNGTYLTAENVADYIVFE